MGMRRRGVRFQEGWRELRLPGILYADDLVLCGELEEDLRAMVGYFVEVYRRGPKFSTGKGKVMVLGGEEGLECKIGVDRIHLGHVSEVKYLGCALDESGTDECSRKVANWRMVAGAIRSLVKARSLHLKCARILHEPFLVPVLTYGNETMIWR